MASYNIDDKDPLIDARLQAVLNKRGREMLGVFLLLLAALSALMLGSYSPKDPGWMVASEGAVQNSLGRLGAALASPLMVILGWASWGIPLFMAGWGLRLVTARGHRAAPARAVFLPLALAASAVWCATFVPYPGWDALHGLGGIFGDTVLAAVVNALPMAPAAGVSFMAGLMMIVCALIWAHVLGVTLHETWRFMQFMVAGLILTYAGLTATLRSGVAGSAKGARMATRAASTAIANRVEDRRTRAQAAADTSWSRPHHPVQPDLTHLPAYPQNHDAPPEAPAVRRAPPVIRPGGYAPTPQAPFEPPLVEDEDWALQPPAFAAPRRAPAQPEPAMSEDDGRPGLLGKLRALSLRQGDTVQMPQPELVEPVLSRGLAQTPPPLPERISARIADAIRTRKPTRPVQQFNPALRPEPPVAGNLRKPAAAAPHPVQPAAPAGFSVAIPPITLQTSVPMPDWMRVATPPATPAITPTADHAIAPAVAPRTVPVRPVAKAAPEPVFEPDFDIDADAVIEEPFDVLRAIPRPGTPVHQRRVVTQPAKPPALSRQAQSEVQPALAFEQRQSLYELPPLSLLESPSSVKRFTLSDEALEENARMLESVLDDYGVRGEIVSVRPGPVVTQYELEPAPGLKASRVIGLSDDIARSMSALSARVSTVPGRSIIGIELPNAHREKVVLREILAARDFGDTQMRLPLALGKAIDGEPVVANLAKMPHLLIAGTTGSGKSVAINTMILSLLYRLTPDECRMIMIDPKMLELSVYDGIPHLLSPVVTDPKKAVVALKWVVGEMEDRYRKMSKMGVRNIEGYNGRVREALGAGEMFKRTIQTGFDDETGDPVFETEEFAPELLPYIVVIVDEMADLMMVAGKEIEACIQRLAQMARASGIHLIMATQRPSVDVITGTIKANFPTRISFQVTSKIDSRTILGEQGAEQLLGQGDMLYMAGGSRIMRVHGPFVSDEEVEEIVNHLKSFGPPDYKSGVVDGPDSDREADIDTVLGLGGNTTGEDALYDQAVQVVIQDRKCSTSYIQRKLGIGYNKAARLVEQMEDEGIVTPANHVGKRDILVPEQG